MSEPIVDVDVNLSNEDGNAFVIIGKVRKALKRAGRNDLVEPFTNEAKSGDYDNVLQTAMKYVNVT